MQNVRKAVAVALARADLSDDPNHETGRDRIGALAFADELGVRLQRVRYANDPGAYKSALLLLVKRMAVSVSVRETIQRVCTIVLNEWLDDHCRSCGGRGWAEIAATGRLGGVCIPCNGTGARIASEQERMRKLGVSPKSYAKWARHFTRASDIIRDADERAVADARRQLRV